MKTSNNVSLKIILAVILVIAQSLATAAEFALGPRGFGIAISGKIVEGDFDRFIVYSASHPKYNSSEISLNSPGGSVEEALKFAEYFTKEFVGTSIENGANCFSSCALIWAGGVDRSISGSARLGFHRLSFLAKEVDVKKSQAILEPANRSVMTFLKSIQFPNFLIEKMYETPPTDLFVVNTAWLLDHDLLNAVLYQPAFLDVAEKQCGVEPTTRSLKKQGQSLSESQLATYKLWNECASKVKDQNIVLSYRNDMQVESDKLASFRTYVANATWKMVYKDDSNSIYVDSKKQSWSGKVTQISTISNYSVIGESSFNPLDKSVGKDTSMYDSSTINCETNTITKKRGAIIVNCDGLMCNKPWHISELESALEIKSKNGTMNWELVKSICIGH